MVGGRREEGAAEQARGSGQSGNGTLKAAKNRLTCYRRGCCCRAGERHRRSKQAEEREWRTPERSMEQVGASTQAGRPALLRSVLLPVAAVRFLGPGRAPARHLHLPPPPQAAPLPRAGPLRPHATGGCRGVAAAGAITGVVCQQLLARLEGAVRHLGRQASGAAMSRRRQGWHGSSPSTPQTPTRQRRVSLPGRQAAGRQGSSLAHRLERGHKLGREGHEPRQQPALHLALHIQLLRRKKAQGRARGAQLSSQGMAAGQGNIN